MLEPFSNNNNNIIQPMGANSATNLMFANHNNVQPNAGMEIYGN